VFELRWAWRAERKGENKSANKGAVDLPDGPYEAAGQRGRQQTTR